MMMVIVKDWLKKLNGREEEKEEEKGRIDGGGGL
jgi:hypothetical protein